jgi:hypothetical protein
VVLYGCETWSLTLREEYRLRVLENRVLRRIFGPKWDVVTGEWRKLLNGEIHNLYSPPNIIRTVKPRMIKLRGHVARMGKRMHMGYCWKFQKEKDHWGNLDVGGRIILKWILEKNFFYLN